MVLQVDAKTKLPAPGRLWKPQRVRWQWVPLELGRQVHVRQKRVELELELRPRRWKAEKRAPDALLRYVAGGRHGLVEALMLPAIEEAHLGLVA